MPSSEGDEISVSARDAGDTWKRMLEKPDHSVKYKDEGDMIYGEIEHRFINAEDEMIENSLVNKKEASNNIENDYDYNYYTYCCVVNLSQIKILFFFLNEI